MPHVEEDLLFLRPRFGGIPPEASVYQAFFSTRTLCLMSRPRRSASPRGSLPLFLLALSISISSVSTSIFIYLFIIFLSFVLV